MLRLLLAAVFPFAPARSWWVIIVAAGLSDLADGLIARRFGLTSWNGGLLDGLADKAFVITVLVTFTIDGRLAVWQTLMLVLRDIMVALLIVGVVVLRRWDAFARMPSRHFGKWTTAALVVLMLALAIWPNAHGWIMLLFVITAALSVLAGVDYAVQFVRGYRAGPPRRES